MKTIVMTGGTRGIGYGMAKAFLARSCNVAISGRTPEAVAQALARLADPGPAERILGVPCDVRDFAQVQGLWERCRDHFGQIDIWINNAGTGGEHGKIWEASPESARQVVETNLLGTIFGSQVAVRGMLDQGGSDLYLMEGGRDSPDCCAGGCPATWDGHHGSGYRPIPGPPPGLGTREKGVQHHCRYC